MTRRDEFQQRERDKGTCAKYDDGEEYLGWEENQFCSTHLTYRCRTGTTTDISNESKIPRNPDVDTVLARTAPLESRFQAARFTLLN